MNVTLKTPLNTSFVGLDLEKLKSTKKENFDIFNPNDDFFHDICIKYSDENDADVPIK
jgi:poly(A) polymerase Pap1